MSGKGPASAAADPGIGEVRLHVVSGKGGTGKSTVSTALAIALASGGRRVLLAEVEGRQGIAHLLGAEPLGYPERRLLAAPGGGEVLGLSVQPEAALLEYLDVAFHLGRAGRLLEKLGAIDFATTVAPGLRDVLLTGKVYEAVRRRSGGEYAYHAVVLDAPPTGRITRFLRANGEMAGLASGGPIHNQAESIMSLLRSPRTAVHLVTLLEEMPVQETAEALEELRVAGLRTGTVVLNLVRERLLPAADLPSAARGALDAGAVSAGLVTAGLGGRTPAPGRAFVPAPGSAGRESGTTERRAHPDRTERLARLAEDLAEEAAAHAARALLEEELRGTAISWELPTVELPALGNGVDEGTLYELARHLREQGMVR